MKRVLFAFLVFIFLYTPAFAVDGVTAATPTVYKVKSIVSGDIIQLIDGTKVRLLGIDIPEGSEDKVKDFVANMVGDWKEVNIRLEYDIEKKDEEKNILAYVYVYQCPLGCYIDADVGYEFKELDNGVYLFVNATLIATGYARVQKTVFPAKQTFMYKHYDEFQGLEKQAKLTKRGFWKEK